MDIPLVEVKPSVYDDYHSEDKGSSTGNKGTNSPAVLPFLVEDDVVDEEEVASRVFFLELNFLHVTLTFTPKSVFQFCHRAPANCRL